MKCGKTFSIMSFGYGKAICPECYEGEQPFIFLDEDFYLNRVMKNLISKKASHKPAGGSDSILYEKLLTARTRLMRST